MMVMGGSRVVEYLSRLRVRFASLAHIPEELERQRILLGAIAVRVLGTYQPTSFADSEFHVFSQFGEDGILQMILRSFGEPVPKAFVEFGVESYREATTRLLLETQGWKGLIIDGDTRNIQSIQERADFWRLPLTAVHAFIDRENINSIIEQGGMAGRIGILSVDLDGNDYWVWEAIDCVTPDIVVVEYNGIFGGSAAVSIPYDASFSRFKAHYSGVYWGCSLGALQHVAQKKGYRLLGVNAAGNNAFFARSDSSCNLPSCSTAETFSWPIFREARGRDGRLSHASPQEASRLIEHLPLIDVISGKTTTLKNTMAYAASEDK